MKIARLIVQNVKARPFVQIVACKTAERLSERAVNFFDSLPRLEIKQINFRQWHAMQILTGLPQTCQGTKVCSCSAPPPALPLHRRYKRQLGSLIQCFLVIVTADVVTNFVW